VGKTIVGIEEFVTPLAVGGGPERAFDSLGHARLLLLTLDAHLLLVGEAKFVARSTRFDNAANGRGASKRSSTLRPASGRR